MGDVDKDLGRLEPVDLREIWKTESDFTSWLAKEENLKLLGDKIGIELELEAQEKDVGPFRADILCRDTATNDWVVIENQLECTDHDHLGKSLTYAAGLNAKTIIWIAKQFTDEHRAALDWLNEISGRGMAFFGVEVELWQIGGSAPAPDFNIVSRPNDWSERVAEVAEGEVTEIKLLQQEYWTALAGLLRERNSVVAPRKPRRKCWMGFSLGRAGFRLSASVSKFGPFIKVGVDCQGPDAKVHFALLEKDKESIEQEVGCPLEWRPLPTRKAKRIELRKKDVDYNIRDDWPSQHLWLAENLEALHRAFAPRIRQLDLDEQQSPDEE